MAQAPSSLSLPVPFHEATVRDAMSQGVISCPAEASLRTVARLMASYRVHAVFVLAHVDEDDEDRQLLGLVSDLDLVLAAAAGTDVSRLTAGQSAEAPLLAIDASEPLEEAARLMSEHRASHLVVLDPESARPLGVVSTLDLACSLANEQGERETHSAS